MIFTSSDVTIEKKQAGEAQQASVITSKLEACDCSADVNSNTDCYKIDTSNIETYNQSDTLSIRLYDPNGNDIITSFKDVELDNGEIGIRTVLIEGPKTRDRRQRFLLVLYP